MWLNGLNLTHFGQMLGLDFEDFGGGSSKFELRTDEVRTRNRLTNLAKSPDYPLAFVYPFA